MCLCSTFTMYVYNVCIKCSRACMAIVATDRQSGNQIPTGFTNPALYSAQYSNPALYPAQYSKPVYLAVC